MVVTVVSFVLFAGLNGAAFNDGFCVMVWEVVAVIAADSSVLGS